MPKYVKLYEDAMDPLTGGGADLFKSYLDTKNAFIDDEHAVDDPKAGGIGQVEEDTTNPPAAQQKDGEELLANDDLSNFALPLTNNENQSPKLKHKMKKVMGEFSKGTLKTSAGKKVTDPKQAVAIGYSEAGESKNENKSYTRKLNADDFIGDKSKPVFKSDTEIHHEREATKKQRDHEKDREAKDKTWNERRKAQSEKDKAKKKTNESVSIFRFEQFVNEKYGPAQEKLEKARQKAEKELMKKDDKTAGQKKVSAIRKKTAKSATT